MEWTDEDIETMCVSKNNFVIDGDSVRKLVSKDLGYTLDDRHIQLNRVIGLAEIAISNNIQM